MQARAGERVWPSCLAALVVLGALLFLLQPALLAVAAPGAAPSALDNPVKVRISPARNALGGGALAPGEPRFHPVRVHNDGTIPFRYELTVRTTGALARLITVEVRAVDGACDATAFAASSATVAGPAPMSDVRGLSARALPPGESQGLCARVELPDGAVIPPDAGPSDAVLRVSAVQR